MTISQIISELIMSEKDMETNFKNKTRSDYNYTSSLSETEIYELFLMLQTFDEMKRSFIMTLCHVFPKELTSNQLSSLSGYSPKSKYIFKSNILESLIEEQIILVTERDRKKLIQLHPDNSLLIKFSDICQKQGKIVQEVLLGKLLEDEFT